MNTNKRFAVAVHALAIMAWRGGVPVKSEELAESIQTNPVVVRRIMGDLSRARLVVSQTGSSGGSRLVRGPDTITLLEIYRAVDADNLFSLSHSPNAHCGFGKHMQSALDDIVSEAEAAVQKVLSNITLAQVFQSVCERAGGEHCLQAK